MAQRVKVCAAQTEDPNSTPSSQSGRKELNPESCSLNSVHVPTSIHVNQINQPTNQMEIKKLYALVLCCQQLL